MKARGNGGKDDEEERIQRHSVIHRYRFNCARTMRDDLLNHTAATSNLNYCDKRSLG